MSDEGIIELGPVPPGTYVLWAVGGGVTERRLRVKNPLLPPDYEYLDYDGSPRFSASMKIEIQDSARDDVVLTLTPAARITGRVMLEGTSSTTNSMTPPLVRAVPAGVISGIGYDLRDLNGRVNADGTFVLDGVVGDACVTLENIPSGWHLKSVLYQGKSIAKVPLTFTSGTEVRDVLVTLAPNTHYVSPDLQPCGSAMSR